jgi:DNA replication protein DnaC
MDLSKQVSTIARSEFRGDYLGDASECASSDYFGLQMASAKRRFFLGPPGTGKSHLVQTIVTAKCLLAKTVHCPSWFDDVHEEMDQAIAA